jgi:ABC-2 type transport system ATP-binding protein
VSAAIVVDGLGRNFGSFVAVRDVNFEVEPGEIFGYLGANGAGKSTTIRMLTGLLEPSAGRASVAGYDVGREPERVKASIGYMSQKFSLYLDLSVRDNLLFFGGAYGLSGRPLRRRAEQLLEQLELVGLEEETTGSLPGGTRQRLALASALLHRPRIVFLDEPTAGVDPLARRMFWRVITELSRNGVTVFVTTHYLDEAEYCARIGLMVDGRLVALDSPAGLKKHYVPERVLTASGRNLSKARTALERQPGIVGITPFGANLHLRVSGDEWTDDRVRSALADGGAQDVSVEVSEPSLEDVFLEVVGRKSPTQEAEP